VKNFFFTQQTERQEYKLLQQGHSSRLTEAKVNELNAIGFVWEAQRGRRKLPEGSEADGEGEANLASVTSNVALAVAPELTESSNIRPLAGLPAGSEQLLAALQRQGLADPQALASAATLAAQRTSLSTASRSAASPSSNEMLLQLMRQASSSEEQKADSSNTINSMSQDLSFIRSLGLRDVAAAAVAQPAVHSGSSVLSLQDQLSRLLKSRGIQHLISGACSASPSVSLGVPTVAANSAGQADISQLFQRLQGMPSEGPQRVDASSQGQLFQMLQRLQSGASGSTSAAPSETSHQGQLLQAIQRHQEDQSDLARSGLSSAEIPKQGQLLQLLQRLGRNASSEATASAPPFGSSASQLAQLLSQSQIEQSGSFSRLTQGTLLHVLQGLNRNPSDNPRLGSSSGLSQDQVSQLLSAIRGNQQAVAVQDAPNQDQLARLLQTLRSASETGQIDPTHSQVQLSQLLQQPHDNTSGANLNTSASGPNSTLSSLLQGREQDQAGAQSSLQEALSLLQAHGLMNQISSTPGAATHISSQHAHGREHTAAQSGGVSIGRFAEQETRSLPSSSLSGRLSAKDAQDMLNGLLLGQLCGEANLQQQQQQQEQQQSSRDQGSVAASLRQLSQPSGVDLTGLLSAAANTTQGQPSTLAPAPPLGADWSRLAAASLEGSLQAQRDLSQSQNEDRGASDLAEDEKQSPDKPGPSKKHRSS
jgi:hypothetical protein